MTPERWAEVGRLFDAAQGLTREGRTEFLERECPGDADMRAEVKSLLASLDGAESFLEHPVAEPLRSPLPRGVGSYEIVGKIGHGGMGVVYKAVRRDQGFERLVAVKLVKRGMDTDFILRRFDSERRILAGLDHPNIARVLDGGSTEDALPYFVMELIEGKNVLEYCDEKRLGIAERLALFQRVCSAVQYAHQRLVIHRDIKPGNILVTAEGVPKLLDFGLAKILAVEEKAVDRTETALRLLTPEYASPEQVRGQELTTASDVYSLGVVLYELLTGERPYRLRTRTSEEISGAVLNQEPEKPSSRAPLHRDLDAVVMMALRKEPARRYASAEQLSEDIRRHLEGLPVRARQDSFGYRAGKFVRRHKLGMAAGALVAASLVAGMAISLWQMRAARFERNRAQAEAIRAQETARFLGGLFQGANPVEARGKTLTARELLDRGTERIAHDLDGQPEIQASLLVVIADAYDRVSAPREALALAERSLSLRERVLAPASLGVAEGLHQVGRLRRRLGQPAQALPLLERATALRETLLGPAHRDVAATLRERALTLNDLGRGVDARPLLERAIAIQERVAPAGASLALLYNNFGFLLLEGGDAAAARKAYERSIAVYERTNETDSWGIAMPLVNLGELLRQQEELDQAETLFQRVLAFDEKLFGAESSGVAYALACLGDLKHAKGDSEGGREMLERSLAIYGRVLPPEHPELAAPLTYLGDVCLTQKRPGEARRLFERALAITERAHGPDHPAAAEALVALARALDASGEKGAAEGLLRRALSIQRKTLAASHRALVPTLTALARALLKQNRGAEARPLLAEAVQIARTRLPDRHSQRLAAEEALRAAGGGGRVRS